MGFPFVRRYMLSQLERMRPLFKQVVIKIDKERSTETQE